MQIILRGPAAGYEAEHTARLFFPDAEKTENLPQDSDFVLAQSHLCTDTILMRLHGRLYWKIALRPQGADPEYTLCRLLYTLLGGGHRQHAALGHDDRRAPGAHHSRHARKRCHGG